MRTNVIAAPVCHAARFIRLFTILAVCAALFALPCSALTLKFTNENPDFPTSNAYVMFRSGVADPFVANYSGGPVALTTSYSFAQLSSGVTLSNITVGVLYISLGKPMSVPVTNVSGVLPEPSASNPVDADYSTRWDTVEITFNGLSYDAANLTGINKFAIPFRLLTFNGATNKASFGYHVDGVTMISNLHDAATDDSAILEDGGGKFLRVLGPTAYAAGFIGPYRPLDAYVTAVQASGTPIMISDMFTGNGVTSNRIPQRYEFTTVFTNLAGVDRLLMSGGSHTSNSIGTNHTISLPTSNVAYQIYANDPHYLIDGATPGSMADNDVYSAAIRDVLAGLASGFVGSTATNQVTGAIFSNEASSNWFGSMQTQAFSDVQTTLPYFNGYGEAFWRCSDVYGFPFADRLRARVLANLNPAEVDTLEIVIQPDIIPEPAAGMLALLLLAAARRRK